MASTAGSKSEEEYLSPSPESIKKGFKSFLELDLEIKKNEKTWFDRFGDEYLSAHLHKKWISSNRCALLFYNRLDPNSRWQMVKDKLTLKEAEAASVTSLGITSYMNYYSFVDIYGETRTKTLWKYLDFGSFCGSSKTDGGTQKL